MDQRARLTPAYLHVRRVFDSLGPTVATEFGPVPADAMERGRYFSLLNARLVAALETTAPLTIGEALLKHEIRQGTIFTHYGAFFSRGVSRFMQRKSETLPGMYTKLDDLRPQLRLTLPVNPEHFTSVSSAVAFSGKQRLLAIGVVAGVARRTIKAHLMAAGQLVSDLSESAEALRMPQWSTMGEVRASSIDAFGFTEKERYATPAELAELERVSEKEIKRVFAHLIGEPYVHHDWGGESSDLFSGRVTIEGYPVSASFLLKGPSRFSPMRHTHLGKVGDQIVRMFDEPSDLFVVQHCHEIVPAIRAVMRAFANQIGRARMFCIIDGAETARILRVARRRGVSVALKERGA